MIKLRKCTLNIRIVIIAYVFLFKYEVEFINSYGYQ